MQNVTTLRIHLIIRKFEPTDVTVLRYIKWLAFEVIPFAITLVKKGFYIACVIVCKISCVCNWNDLIFFKENYVAYWISFMGISSNIDSCHFSEINFCQILIVALWVFSPSLISKARWFLPCLSINSEWNHLRTRTMFCIVIEFKMSQSESF